MLAKTHRSPATTRHRCEGSRRASAGIKPGVGGDGELVSVSVQAVYENYVDTQFRAVDRRHAAELEVMGRRIPCRGFRVKFQSTPLEQGRATEAGAENLPAGCEEEL